MINSAFFLSVFIVLGFQNSVRAEGAVSDLDAQDAKNSEQRTTAAQGLIPQEAKLDTAEPEPEKIPEIKIKPGQSLKLHGTIEEANLTIEWDEWHNRFAKAVRSGMFKSMFETINMRPGSITWYHCDVDSERHLKNVSITRSSGDFWYDSAVINAVKKLDGNDVLKFPAGSKRMQVSTDIGIRLGGPRTGELNFGDVEYRPLAPGEQAPESHPPESQDKKAGKKRKTKSE